jgi:hypothetical protein
MYRDTGTEYEIQAVNCSVHICLTADDEVFISLAERPLFAEHLISIRMVIACPGRM